MVGLVHRWSSPGVVHVTHTTYTTHHVHHGGHWAAGPDPNSIEFSSYLIWLSRLSNLVKPAMEHLHV